VIMVDVWMYQIFFNGGSGDYTDPSIIICQSLNTIIGHSALCHYMYLILNRV
jgi:hypothetical protein